MSRVDMSRVDISRVDIKSPPAFGRDNKKVAHLVLIAQVIEQGPAAAVEKRLLVVAKAVQKIKYGITFLRMLRSARIVPCGQVNAVVDDLLEDMAGESVAIDAALRGRRRGGYQHEQASEPEGADHAGQSTRSAAPVPDPVWPPARLDTIQKPGSPGKRK